MLVHGQQAFTKILPSDTKQIFSLKRRNLKRATKDQEHSREAVDWLDQDQVGLWVTARQHLSAPPQLPRLFQDGVVLLFLHFHIVNRYVAAKENGFISELAVMLNTFLREQQVCVCVFGGDMSPFCEHLHRVLLQAGLLLKDPLLQH